MPMLIERQTEPHDVVCGGFLAADAIAMLARIGIDVFALGAHPIGCTRIIAGRRRAEAELPFAAAGLSRNRLDACLLQEAIDKGAAVERGVAIRRVDQAARCLDLADGGRIGGEALFLATGKHDLRGAARPAEARGADPTLGLRVRLAPSPALTAALRGRIELHLFDRGYAGLVLQEDGSANLCMAVHRSRLHAAGSPVALLAALGREAPRLGERLADLPGDAGVDAIANVPYGWRQRQGVPGLFRVGDQAGVIPSLAGEGMGIALASGVGAAEACLTGGPAAAVAWQRRFARDLARPMAVAGLVRGLAERRLSSAVLAVMPARLIQVIAHATRMEA